MMIKERKIKYRIPPSTLKKDWEVFVTRKNVPILFISLFYDAQYPKSKTEKYAGIPFEIKELYRTGDKYYYRVSEIESLDRFLYQFCKENFNRVKEIVDLCKKNAQKTIMISKKLGEKSSKKILSTKSLTNYFHKYYSALSCSFAFLLLKHRLSLILEKMLREFLRKENKKVELLMDEINKKLLIPKGETAESRLKRELEIIARNINFLHKKKLFLDPNSSLRDISIFLVNNPACEEIQNRLLNVYKNYSWMKRVYWNEDPYELSDFLKMVMKLVHASNEKSRHRGKYNYSELLHEFKKAYNVSTTVCDLIQVLRNFQEYHALNIESIFASEYFALPFISQLTRHLNLSIKEYHYLTHFEVIEALETAKDFRNIALARIGNYSLYFRCGNFYIEPRTLFPLLKEEKKEVEHELIGIPACGGRAMGKAKVITDIKNISDLEDGDILITIMTTVDWGPALSEIKIAGIVTDEGGATSHAAKLAREKNIPCVVGTKNATKIFRNSMLIIVDGSKGMVKEVKENKPKGK